MSDISVRDLRNNCAEVLDRVSRGEALTVTRDGRPVAELRPLPRKPLGAAVVLGRWRRLPPLDDVRLKTDWKSCP